ncbi:SIGMA FACTOR SIGB REGULATION PROTEIN RSBQ [Salix koriyanagi]|uniref:SIGMA FACTOR SIGB REGULATION PROTEIN RSBQ n=1 Tax=Salix koriyanagi TaxID=2511006 RepID=A0A9Q0X3K2_9ROSI|nr:SIGMA FACTOR SIGB REGULATION PROTEIN RSBQ [Salix koriyanagi]
MDAHGYGGGTYAALNGKIYGNGTETLVLAHGYGTDQSVWHYLVPYLACCFKVVVFDLVFSANVSPDLYNPKKYSSFNGYASDLVNLLDELNVNKTIFVPLMRKDTMGGFTRSEINALFKQMDRNYTSWVQAFAPAAVGMNNTPATTEFKNSLWRMKPEIALSVARAVFLSDWRSILPKVLVPCTIIQSKRDPIVPNSVAYYMKRNLHGHARVEILDTRGHFPQLTAYNLLLKVLKRFLVIS